MNFELLPGAVWRYRDCFTAASLHQTASSPECTTLHGATTRDTGLLAGRSWSSSSACCSEVYDSCRCNLSVLLGSFSSGGSKLYWSPWRLPLWDEATTCP